MWQVLFEIPTPFGPIPVFGFGLMLFSAFIACTWLAGRLGEREGIPAQKTHDLALWIFVGGLIVARITFLTTKEADVHSLYEALVRFVQIWQGGIVFYGSFLGGVLAFSLAWYVAFRPFGIRYWQLADVVAPTVALGLALGRIGCFLNGCCYGHVACEECVVTPAYFPSLTAPARYTLVERNGYQTLAGFAMLETPGHDDRIVSALEPGSAAERAGLKPGDMITSVNGRPINNYRQLSAALYPDGGLKRGDTTLRLTVERDGRVFDLPAFTPRLIGVYPTQLYETITALLLMAMLLAYYPLRRHHGRVFTLLLVGYAIHRFINEQLRNDTLPVKWFPIPVDLTLSQNVSLVILFGVVPVLELILRRTQPRLTTPAGPRDFSPGPAGSSSVSQPAH